MFNPSTNWSPSFWRHICRAISPLLATDHSQVIQILGHPFQVMSYLDVLPVSLDSFHNIPCSERTLLVRIHLIQGLPPSYT